MSGEGPRGIGYGATSVIVIDGDDSNEISTVSWEDSKRMREAQRKSFAEFDEGLADVAIDDDRRKALIDRILGLGDDD